MVELCSWVLVAGSIFATWYLIRTRGFYDGARTVWIVVMLLAPVWMKIEPPIVKSFFGFDARSVCALVFLIGFLREPCRSGTSRGWYLTDLFILSIITTVTVSQFLMKKADPLEPFNTAREFALPYLVGRFFIRNDEDIKSILPVFCKCIVILAVLALFEAFTTKNPLDLVFHRPWAPEDVNSGTGAELDSLRMGLKRAYAVQTHPIYLGLTFAMTLPWAVEAAVQAWNRQGPAWWKLMPLWSLGGVISTGSRAAQICSIIVLVAMCYQASPRWRPVMIVAIILGGISFVSARDDIMKFLESYAEENTEGDAFVIIDGVQFEYSGTKHRDLLFEVYKEGYANAGWFGYGFGRDKIPQDPNMDKRFRSIDNHYLYFYLQYGYMGFAIFGLLAASAFWNLMPSVVNSTGPTGRLAGGLFGASAGCLIGMRSVWFAPDYAAVWLFCVGLSVSLARCYRESRLTGAHYRA